MNTQLCNHKEGVRGKLVSPVHNCVPYLKTTNIATSKMNLTVDPSSSSGFSNQLFYKIHEACNENLLDQLQDLIAFAKEQNITKWKTLNMTMTAAEKGHLTCLKILVENDCPINNRIMMAACSKGRIEVVKYLLSKHVALDFVCLLVSIEAGHTECFSFLLTQYCQVSGDLQIMLEHAARNKQYKCCEKLILLGARVNSHILYLVLTEPETSMQIMSLKIALRHIGEMTALDVMSVMKWLCTHPFDPEDCDIRLFLESHLVELKNHKRAYEVYLELQRKIETIVQVCKDCLEGRVCESVILFVIQYYL